MSGSRATACEYSDIEAMFTQGVADLYKLRPAYTDIVFERIQRFCENIHSGFNLAVDLCCGSGDMSVPIAKFFKQVVAVDISEAQIANAPTDIPNVDFKIGSCYDVPSVLSGTADLIVIGTALHLVDIDKVYKETDRMLKPGGAFILVVYSPGVFNIKECTAVMDEHLSALHDAFPDMLPMVRAGYAATRLPYPAVKRYTGDVSLEKDYSPEEFIQLLGSIPNKTEYHVATGEHKISEIVKERIHRICQTKCDPNVERPIHATFPLHMVMTQKPKY